MLHNSEKDFIKRHIGLKKKDEKKMLSELGYDSINDLISSTVPNKILLKDLFTRISLNGSPSSAKSLFLKTFSSVIKFP